MQDSYGDGWQSAGGIEVNMDGTIVYATLCNAWGDLVDGCVNDSGNLTDNYGGTTTVTIPAGTASATWTYMGDSYPGEVTFQVYGPDGSMVYDSGSDPGPGLLPIAVCAG